MQYVLKYTEFLSIVWSPRFVKRYASFVSLCVCVHVAVHTKLYVETCACKYCIICVDDVLSMYKYYLVCSEVGTQHTCIFLKIVSGENSTCLHVCMILTFFVCFLYGLLYSCPCLILFYCLFYKHVQSVMPY